MTIELLQGDITRVKTDAIVNCTTIKLVIGGGALDMAIHRAAGPGLMEACQRIIGEKKNIAIGECVITDAYKLPCKKVIHTAGPVYMGGSWNEAEHLAGCYRSALVAADEAHCESIAFPNLCTGAHTYPKQSAAVIALDTVRKMLPTLTALKRVVFVCLEEENYRIYNQLLSAET
ncbi:MAG: macro domain-containing protein [Spirochaetaceae bacterium]|nr:macro domain-containing protein [Spirochaetaceae bacterium]